MRKIGGEVGYGGREKGNWNRRRGSHRRERGEVFTYIVMARVNREV
jgi:hypothetical protein